MTVWRLDPPPGARKQPGYFIKPDFSPLPTAAIAVQTRSPVQCPGHFSAMALRAAQLFPLRRRHQPMM